MNEKTPLSKAILEWDNGSSDRKKVDYTIDQIDRTIRTDARYKKMLHSNQLQINLRGSFSKNNAISESDDIDVQLGFMIEVSLEKEKQNIFSVLSQQFGCEFVQKKNRSITILPNKKRLKADLIVCHLEEGQVNVFNEHTGEDEHFYSSEEQRIIGQLNSISNDNYSRMVRTFKSLRENVYTYSGKDYHILSFAIECILFKLHRKLFTKQYDKNKSEDERKRFLAIEAAAMALLENAESLDDIMEINGEKRLFKNKKQYNAFYSYWQGQHNYLTKHYDFQN